MNQNVLYLYINKIFNTVSENFDCEINSKVQLTIWCFHMHWKLKITKNPTFKTSSCSVTCHKKKKEKIKFNSVIWCYMINHVVMEFKGKLGAHKKGSEKVHQTWRDMSMDLLLSHCLMASPIYKARTSSAH